MTIKDSGNRRRFESGAVRDMAEGKGRCDLLPLFEFNTIIRDNNGYPNYFLGYLSQFEEDGVEIHLMSAFEQMLEELDWNLWQAMLEVAIHFEEGAAKYGDNNWRKGIPANVYIDSCIRHYCKFKMGMTDERHDRAILWNLICCMWTIREMPELNVYAQVEPNDESIHLIEENRKNIKELKQEHPEIDDKYLLDMVKMYIWLNKKGDKK